MCFIALFLYLDLFSVNDLPHARIEGMDERVLVPDFSEYIEKKRNWEPVALGVALSNLCVGKLKSVEI